MWFTSKITGISGIHAIPALQFPRKVPVNHCKHLQCSFGKPFSPNKILNHFWPMWAATISRHPPARCLKFYYFCNLMPCPKCTRFYTKAPAGLWIDCLLQLLKSSSHFSTIDYAEWCARTQPFKVALALPNRFLSLINISKIALIFSFMYTFSSL